MSLVLVVHHEHFVWLVPVDVQLGKLLIPLDVLGWETNGVRNVLLGIFYLRAQVQQDYLG